MPTVNIPKLGPVDYFTEDFPDNIKGMTLVGNLNAPLLINERLLPGAKLDYVVAHEAGHRLTIEMALIAIANDPKLMDADHGVASTLTRFFINNGLTKQDMVAKHPETVSNLDKIFSDNANGRWTPEPIAIEFVAEVFANWATSVGRTPPAIEKIFTEITSAKVKGKLPPLSPFVPSTQPVTSSAASRFGGYYDIDAH